MYRMHRRTWTWTTFDSRRKWVASISRSQKSRVTLLIPHSVWNAEEASPIMQYGHGLLGAQDEVEGDPVTEVANTYGAVVLAQVVRLCSRDLNAVSTMIVNDIDRFAIVQAKSARVY